MTNKQRLYAATTALILAAFTAAAGYVQSSTAASRETVKRQDIRSCLYAQQCTPAAYAAVLAMTNKDTR